MLSGLNLSIFWALLSAREQFEAVGIRDTAVQIKLIKNRSIKIISINHRTVGMSWGIYDLFSLLFICPDSRKKLLRKVVQWLDKKCTLPVLMSDQVHFSSFQRTVNTEGSNGPTLQFWSNQFRQNCCQSGSFLFAMYRMCLSPHQLDNLKDANH